MTEFCLRLFQIQSVRKRDQRVLHQANERLHCTSSASIEECRQGKMGISPSTVLPSRREKEGKENQGK